MRQVANLFDLLAILPLYIQWGMQNSNAQGLRVLRIVRLTRPSRLSGTHRCMELHRFWLILKHCTQKGSSVLKEAAHCTQKGSTLYSKGSIVLKKGAVYSKSWLYTPSWLSGLIEAQ